MPAILAAELPSFDQFRAEDVFKGKPAEPKLTTAFAREYRTEIREAAAKGPNFAGKFAIAQWGCGGGCVQMAVINEQTGAVANGPFRTFSFASALSFPDKSSSTADNFEPLVFHSDSRLLIARGCPNEVEKACALFYYEWDGSKFRLLEKLPAKP